VIEVTLEFVMHLDTLIGGLASRPLTIGSSASDPRVGVARSTDGRSAADVTAEPVAEEPRPPPGSTAEP
jgi:hypothetical protein